MCISIVGRDGVRTPAFGVLECAGVRFAYRQPTSATAKKEY